MVSNWTDGFPMRCLQWFLIKNKYDGTMQAEVTHSWSRGRLRNPSLWARVDSWSARPAAGSSLEGAKLWRKKSCISSTSVYLCNNPSPSFVPDSFPTERQSEGTERGNGKSSLFKIYLNLCFSSCRTQILSISRIRWVKNREFCCLRSAGCARYWISMYVLAHVSLCSETVGCVKTSERIHIWSASVWRHTGSHLCGTSS